MAAPQASSRLEMLQARFQQKQLQEKEQKLLQLYDQQQQRAYQVVQRGSAGSNGSNHGSMTRTTTTTHTTSTSQGGKVRQMFDERRQTTVKGIDRSYPLEPLENKLRKQATNGLTTQRNGNLTTVNRQSVNVKRVARADVNSNVNGGKPVVSYREEVTRESFGPSVHRHDDEDEFGSENRVVNGHHRHDLDNEEEVLDQETIESNRMMAKIHLMGFDESLKHRVRNDLESEEFPEYLMADVPDKLPKRSVTKKLTQAEARLERFKNANAKRSNNNAPKQPTTTGAATKRRTEQMLPARSNSRIAKSPSPDASARKQHETSARATRGSAPSSPSKSPDRHVAPRRGSTEPKNQDARLARRPVVAKAAESIGSKTTTEAMDAVDGVVQQDGSPRESSAKKSDAFVIDLDDRPKESDTTPPKKVTPIRRSSNDKNQTTSSATGRPSSSVSSNFGSAGTTQSQASSTKSRMATRAKTPVSGGSQARGPSAARNVGNTNSADNLVACHTCGRNFAQDRIDLHQQICAKTTNKKRKQFDAMTFRVRGTELEPFVKKGVAKKQESRAKKPGLKSNWRRKHEEFIETIRSAKMVQSHLAAGGSLKDLPPPPPSDTSDYIQCPHCSRRFNQAAAERHIPKCEHMLHNKPAHARAARPRR
ncbi:uncharacterized protein LOC116840916 isoform X2 [Odontomachus brunneus]|uniref:uncharacterized protein LOC116840916 isoform X2 n=1 Tax=Odontomachus brunneus TaxID=486640 RepID=UPI0013F26EBD|nr:uncharacterized protein LOC116840916 isoform X2 [Odontomachus brunneus]